MTTRGRSTPATRQSTMKRVAPVTGATPARGALKVPIPWIPGKSFLRHNADSPKHEAEHDSAGFSVRDRGHRWSPLVTVGHRWRLIRRQMLGAYETKLAVRCCYLATFA